MDIPEINLKDIFDSKHAQRLLVLGSSGSGKSYFMKLLYKANKRRFDELVVVTDSLNHHFYRKFDPAVQVEDDETKMIDIAEGLIADQLENHLLDTRRDGTYVFDRELLMIIDDVISKKMVFDDRWSKVYGTARKAGMSITFLSHSPHVMVSAPMKLSSSWVVIFNLGGSQSAIQWAIQLIADKLPTNEFESRKDHLLRARAIYHNITKNKYNAIVIDNNSSQIYRYSGTF